MKFSSDDKVAVVETYHKATIDGVTRYPEPNDLGHPYMVQTMRLGHLFGFDSKSDFGYRVIEVRDRREGDPEITGGMIYVDVVPRES